MRLEMPSNSRWRESTVKTVWRKPLSDPVAAADRQTIRDPRSTPRLVCTDAEAVSETASLMRVVRTLGKSCCLCSRLLDFFRSGKGVK